MTRSFFLLFSFLWMNDFFPQPVKAGNVYQHFADIVPDTMIDYKFASQGSVSSEAYYIDADGDAVNDYAVMAYSQTRREAEQIL